MKKIALLLIITLLEIKTAAAIDQIQIEIGEFTTQDVQLKHASAELALKPDSSLGIKTHFPVIRVSEPYAGLQALDLNCSNLQAYSSRTICRDGVLTLQTTTQRDLRFPFSVEHGEQGVELLLQGLPFSSHANLELQWNDPVWEITPNIVDFDVSSLNSLLAEYGIMDAKALLNLQGFVAMQSNDQLQTNLTLTSQRFTAQTSDATKAVENIKLQADFIANSSDSGAFNGQANLQLIGGAAYLQPIFLDLKDSELQATADFSYDQQGDLLHLADFSLEHQDVFDITGTLTSSTESLFPPIDAEIAVTIDDLAHFFNSYISVYMDSSGDKPHLSAVQGKLDLHAKLRQQRPIVLQASATDFSATYSANNGTIQLNGANIALFWRATECTEKSFIYWKDGVFRGIPLSETVLRFNACGQGLQFEKNVTLPLLDGELQFKQLDLNKLDSGQLDLAFAADIKKVSLEALSAAFDLPPLDGTISASIPSVRLEQGGLHLDGKITIQVFGGDVEIDNLQIEGMLGSYPILTADITVHKIDLGKLSRRFSFGYIEGKLSGSVMGLRIEDNQITAFDAEFSTPDNRILPYKIGQKAVENIASLGGSSPTDLLSRGVLGFFESFYYSQLGFTCKLRQHVCELNGVESAANAGFYLIKGAFAPQINVIGYNHRVNWDELVTRLKRISADSAPVIQ